MPHPRRLPSYACSIQATPLHRLLGLTFADRQTAPDRCQDQHNSEPEGRMQLETQAPLLMLSPQPWGGGVSANEAESTALARDICAPDIPKYRYILSLQSSTWPSPARSKAMSVSSVPDVNILLRRSFRTRTAQMRRSGLKR